MKPPVQYHTISWHYSGKEILVLGNPPLVVIYKLKRLNTLLSPCIPGITTLHFDFLPTAYHTNTYLSKFFLSISSPFFSVLKHTLSDIYLLPFILTHLLSHLYSNMHPKICRSYLFINQCQFLSQLPQAPALSMVLFHHKCRDLNCEVPT